MKHIGVNPTENQNTAVHRADAHVAHADDDDERAVSYTHLTLPTSV